MGNLLTILNSRLKNLFNKNTVIDDDEEFVDLDLAYVLFFFLVSLSISIRLYKVPASKLIPF